MGERGLARLGDGAAALAVFSAGLVLAGIAATADAASTNTATANTATANTATSNTAAPTAPASPARSGAVDIYRADCAHCHGPRGEGSYRGPPLAGTGAVSTHFMLSTGRMPIDEVGSRPRRSPPAYDEATIDALAAYVASFGGGPAVVRPDPSRGDLARGGELYRIHCGGCHGAMGGGGAMAFGDQAPDLLAAEPVEVAASLVVGPGAMPKLHPGVLDQDDVDDVVAYVGHLQTADRTGGLPIGSGGRVGEGLVAWAVGLGGAVAATVVLSSRLGGRPAVEARHAVLPPQPPYQGPSRRTVVMGMLGAAGAAALSGASFASVLGKANRELATTSWRAGARLVDASGRPVAAEDLAVGAVATVFPEGAVSDADSQAVVIRLKTGAGTEGLVAYSKLCTHMGCPLGMYQERTGVLLCPCHQAAFDVSDGGRPVVGPASRALPSLPLGVDGEGFLRAGGDFSGPVGPGYWTRP